MTGTWQRNYKSQKAAEAEDGKRRYEGGTEKTNSLSSFQ